MISNLTPIVNDELLENQVIQMNISYRSIMDTAINEKNIFFRLLDIVLIIYFYSGD